MRLDRVSRYGPELAAVPHLSAMAADLAGAAADLTTVLSSTLPVLETDGRFVSAVEVLRENLPLLTRAHARLQHAAYERTFLDPARWDDPPLAELAPLVEKVDAILPAANRGLGLLIALLPHADALLGMDAPRRYLLVGQNNYELRATGGFMGSMGPLEVYRGEIVSLDYRRSYDWDNPNRAKIQPPSPYVRYMRFGAWFIRDANFAPDFRATARTLQMFWEKDGHGALDGVIAVDLTAVQMLLEAVAPLEVPGYGLRVGGTGTLESIWENYRQDPGFLTALTHALFDRLQEPGTIAPGQLQALLGAFGRALEEKHILLYLNEPEVQEAIARAGWGGAIRSDAGDFLMVVDSDFSYAEVNRFIEQEIRYRVTLDPSLRVQESTVTLSYWNHFDRWSSAETREQFGGACFDPNTEDLEPLPGCYGDYIRIYVPQGSRFLGATGFDDGMEYRDEFGRTCIAGYLRVLPGEQRTVSVSYVPPVTALGGQYWLVLEKQPGTDAVPVEVEITMVGSAPEQTRLLTDLRTDRTVVARRQDGRLIAWSWGPASRSWDERRRVQEEQFAAGWELWQAGRAEEALARWQAARVLDLVLDRANLLLFRGEATEAEALCRAVQTIDPSSARAAFLLGEALQAKGDEAGARSAWEEAVRLDPDNRAARLELGLWYEAQGDIEQAYAHLQYADRAEATQALWQRVWPYLNGGEEAAGLAALDLIVRLVPEDANAWMVIASRYRMARRCTEAQAALEQLWRVAPGDIRYYLERAQLLAAQGKGTEALEELEQAVQVAPRSAEAWFLLGQTRRQLGRKDAVAALEQAFSLHPNAWYATELGNAYREQGELDTAVRIWERAVALPGRNAYTWWTLGQGYEAQQRWADAAEAYAQASALEPNNAELYVLQARAYTQAGDRARAIRAWEAALALQPDNLAWQEALARLKE